MSDTLTVPSSDKILIKKKENAEEITLPPVVAKAEAGR